MSGGTGHERLGRSRLFAYGLPALPLACLALPLYIVVPSFYATHVGMTLATVGAVLLAVRLVDAVLDPVIGLWADRGRFPLGRRRGLFLIAAPFAGLSAYMVMTPPEGAGTLYLLLWATAASVAFTTVTLPLTAWGAELSGDYEERTRLSAWREGLGLSGTLVAILLPVIAGGAPDSPAGLLALGLFVAIAMPATALLAVRIVPEPRDHTVNRLSASAIITTLGGNRPFLRLVTAFLLNGFANAIPATLFLPFVAARLGATEWQGPLLILYFAAAIAGVPLATLAAARIGKHRAWAIAMIAASAIFLSATMLGEGDVIAFAVISGLTGLLLGFDLALPPSIQADVIDEDTARTGEQRSGIYFAAWALATKLATALAAGLVLPLLSWAGFEPSATTHSGDALLWLSLLYAGLPIAPKLLAIALMWNFPIDRERQLRLRAEIEGAQA